jgi:hypothetical protein
VEFRENHRYVGRCPWRDLRPYIHPWSTGSDLHFTLSLWSNYSVMLMRATLSNTTS